MYKTLIALLLLKLSQEIIKGALLSSKPLKLIACEHDEMNVRCPSGFIINIISVVYGRKTDNICFDPDSRDKLCESRQAYQIVQSECKDKESCIIAVKDENLGNPCPGVRKYLQVTFNCQTAKVTTLTACDQEDMILTCTDEKKIWIVKTVYGRRNAITCPIQYSSIEDVETINCYSPHASEVVEKRCNDQSICYLVASPMDLGDDPCEETSKYLQVDYQCKD